MGRELNPTSADIAELVNSNPVAREQLRAIILERLLSEAEAKLAQAAERKTTQEEAPQEETVEEY